MSVYRCVAIRLNVIFSMRIRNVVVLRRTVKDEMKCNHSECTHIEPESLNVRPRVSERERERERIESVRAACARAFHVFVRYCKGREKKAQK